MVEDLIIAAKDEAKRMADLAVADMRKDHELTLAIWEAVYADTLFGEIEGKLS
jgi:hypothetical protein